jgi:hypothetical protein
MAMRVTHETLSPVVDNWRNIILPIIKKLRRTAHFQFAHFWRRRRGKGFVAVMLFKG